MLRSHPCRQPLFSRRHLCCAVLFVHSQYAFIQTSATPFISSMGATLTGLSTTATYYVTFYIGVRLGGSTGEIEPNATQSQVTLTYGGTTVWTSVSNISDSNGYMFVQTDPFTPTTASALFNFTVVSMSDLDHSILIDAVMIVPTNVAVNGTLTIGTTTDFDTPVIEGQYDYNTPVTPYQPWTWTAGLGGRASIGSPFDPPAPITPPSGQQVTHHPPRKATKQHWSTACRVTVIELTLFVLCAVVRVQYAFLQTAPNGANVTTSSMTATLSGLTSSDSYITTFWWAVRADQNQEPEAGNQTQSSFSVLVNGMVVYQSAANVSDIGGWAYVQTDVWQPATINNGQATITFYVTATTLHDHTILFDSVSVVLAGALNVPSLADFESPSVDYLYNPPITPLQPWTFDASRGGIAHGGSPFDPAAPSQAPSNTQYAFLQTSGDLETFMNATLFNLTAGVSYQVSFYYATRYDSGNGLTTESQLTLYIGGAQLWQSPANISDPAGWTYVPPISFTGTGNVPILFSVIALGTEDRSILIDAVRLTSNAPLPTYYVYADQTVSFENPSLAFTSNFQYNPPLSASQPFTWSLITIGGVNYGGGGLASLGSPWDPPSPSTPPSGSQYALLQTSPNGVLGLQLSNMSASAYLTGGYSYNVTFYYAARAASSSEPEAGNATQSTLSVLINGAQVWTSGPNLSDTGGWIYAVSSSFAAANGVNSIVFVDQSSTNDDHAVLVDSVTIVNVGGVGSAPGSPSSSSSTPSASSVSASSAAAASSSSAGSAASSASAVGAPSSSSAASAASSSSATGAVSSSISAAAPSSSSVAASSTAAVTVTSSPSSTAAVTVTSSSSAAASSTAPPAVTSSSSVSPSSTAAPAPTSATSSPSSTAAPAPTSAAASSSVVVVTPTSSPTVASSTAGGPTFVNAAVVGKAVSAPLIVLVSAAVLLLLL